jgi:hypothetical protein
MHHSIRHLTVVAGDKRSRALVLHNLRHARRMQLVLLAAAGLPIILGAVTQAAEGALSEALVASIQGWVRDARCPAPAS